MKRIAAILLLVSPALAVRGPSDSLQGVQIFPTDSFWNTPCDYMPLSSSNTLWTGIAAHGGHNLHADFGNTYLGKLNGIPYNIVGNGQSLQSITVGSYASESDARPAGGVPIPSDVFVEGSPEPLDMGSDRHMIVVDTDTHNLYEMSYSSAWPNGWHVAQYSQWSLDSNALRTDGWTSADAAGLAILPGLIRWDEIVAGEIKHAIRFTLDLTHGPYFWPARHDANTGGGTAPAFGVRWRLKSSFDASSYSATNKIIIAAMKKYGLILADNGGDWYISGAPNPNWDSTDLANLGAIVPQNDMEVVNELAWMVDANSGQARDPSTPATTAGPRALRGHGPMKGRGFLR